jgi:hypothetical protein
MKKRKIISKITIYFIVIFFIISTSQLYVLAESGKKRGDGKGDTNPPSPPPTGPNNETDGNAYNNTEQNQDQNTDNVNSTQNREQNRNEEHNGQCNQNGETYQYRKQKRLGENDILQKLRNRICDMLGICQGGVNLKNITGILSFDGTNFYIEDVELHFGPSWYINNTNSTFDYDGDGYLELIYDELQGLLGTEVTIEGHLQSSGWMSVFTINGEIYREPGQPFWASQNHWRWQHRKGQNTP